MGQLNVWITYSPPGTGGVDVPSKNIAEGILMKGTDGVVGLE